MPLGWSQITYASNRRALALFKTTEYFPKRAKALDIFIIYCPQPKGMGLLKHANLLVLIPLMISLWVDIKSKCYRNTFLF